jgi:alpha-1,2-mannosyltransferase
MLRNNLTLLSMYLWVGIFTLQPHKEERFMYVIYPLICYNAAHAVESTVYVVGTLLSRWVDKSVSRALSRSIQYGILGVYALFSLARILAQVRGFSATMQVYGNLESPSTICLGKEWYRFPSSFFIPNTSRANFVKSAFDGLLPGQFLESGEGWRSATWRLPEGMNDQNQEEASHLVSSAANESHTRSPLKSATILLIRTFHTDMRKLTTH